MPTFNLFKEDLRNLLLVSSITSLVDDRIFFGHLATLQTDFETTIKQGGPATFPFPFPAVTIQIMEGQERVWIHQFFPIMVGVHSNLNFDESHTIMEAVSNIYDNAQPDRKKFNVRADQVSFDMYEAESRLYHVFRQFRVNRIGVQT
jgi:hypothetical protein